MHVELYMGPAPRVPADEVVNGNELLKSESHSDRKRVLPIDAAGGTD